MDNILPPDDVEAIARRYTGTQLADLADSHERLRAMFEEACERIAKQSELLSRRAEGTDRAEGTGKAGAAEANGAVGGD